MNERIREIASHCFDVVPCDNDLRDFVKMIINEYDRIISNQIQEYRFDDRLHLGLGDVRLTIGMQDDILEKVKEHFGVEE